MRRHNSKTEEQHQAFAKSIAQGKSIKDAMIEAGYSEKQARKGKAALSQPMLAALANQAKEFANLGKSINAQEQENIVRGRLIFNAVNGTDDGVQSAKYLGSDKRVAMFTADSQAGVVAIQVNIGDKEEAKPLPSVTIRELPE